MKSTPVLLFVVLLGAVAPSFALKTRTHSYPVACSVLWPAVEGVLKTSGKYDIVAVNDAEMTASFVTGGTIWDGEVQRLDLIALRGSGSGCELTVTGSPYDARQLKKRVDASVGKK